MKIRSSAVFARRACLLLIVMVSLGCESVVDKIVETAAERRTSVVQTDLLDDDALSVFLCGTGSPLADANSAAACTMVIAGGKIYVVDVGPGSQEVAQLAGMPTAALGGIFLTHFHSDHIGELGEWAMQSWVAGRSEPLKVYGPEGVDRVVSGFKQAYRLDDAYRIEHHGPEILSTAATEWISHALPYQDGPGTKILEENGLVVTAFAVDHEPVEPAVGYRFDYEGRSVVISGDTDRSENLEINARGADLLVHEVLLKSVIGDLSQLMERAGQARMAKLSGDILEYHTSPSEAAETAKQAGVDTLVFTHLVPTVPGVIREWLFMREVEAGDVEVVVGEDAMRIRLPVGSSEIEIE